MKPFRYALTLSALGFLLIFLLNTFVEGNTIPLSSNSALTMIKASKGYLKIIGPLPLHLEGFQKGMNQGYWSGETIIRDGSPVFSPLDVKITAKGEEIFNDIKVTPEGLTSVTLVRPPQPKLEIKTLYKENTESNTFKAEFTWKYHHIPHQAKRFVVRGGNGVAIFSSSLKGWMITDLKLDFSEIPAPLNSEERLLEKKDIQRQQELQRIEEEKKKAKQKKYWSLLRESKTPTQEIDQWEFKFSIDHPSTSLKRDYHFIAKITDVHLKVQGTEKTGTTEVDYFYTFWFNDIEDISMGYNPKDNLYWVEIINKFGRKALWGSENQDDIQRAYNTLTSAKISWDDKFGGNIQKNPFTFP